MSNKIDNNFGAGSANLDSLEKKPRERANTSSSKNFGEFLRVDEGEDFSSQSDGAEEGELSNESSPFSSIFRNIGSTRDEDERDDSAGTRSRPDSRRTDSRPRTGNEYQPDHKPKYKDKPVAAKGGETEQKEKKRLNEPSQPNALAPFHVPMQVDQIRGAAPVEKSAPVVPAQMIDQIVQEVRLGINARGEAEFQFDLKSDVLDGLKLKISTKNGQVSASFIAENVHVKDRIDQNVQELIKALQSRGLEVANFQVSVGADTSGSGQGQQSQQQPYAPQDAYTAESGRSVSADGAEPEQPNATRSSTDYTV